MARTTGASSSWASDVTAVSGAASIRELASIRADFCLEDEQGKKVLVPAILPLEDSSIESLSPSLLDEVNIDWAYSNTTTTSEDDSIVEVKVSQPKKEEGKKQEASVKGVSGEKKRDETEPVNVNQSGKPCAVSSLQNRHKRIRMRIQSCSICFEDEDRIHECEEAELILLCAVHNKINCFKYQFVIYLPAHGYIPFLQIESEAQMGFLVKCFHALVGKYHLDLRFGSSRSKFFDAPSQIDCNSTSYDSLAMPLKQFRFMENIRLFFFRQIQRMLTNMQPMGNKIMYKRFAFYHEDLATEIFTHSDKTVGIEYERVVNPEIAFMKCEHLICANSLF